MRTILLVCLISIASFSRAQVSLNRAMLNVNFGIRYFGEVGLRAQFDRFFAVGVYGNYINEPIKSASGYELSEYTTKRNEVSNVTAYAGISSRSQSIISFTVLAGPSFGRYEVHKNIQFESYPNGSILVATDRQESSRLGFGFRGEMTLALAKGVGINAGVLGNLNGAHNYFRVHVGFCFGMMSRD